MDGWISKALAQWKQPDKKEYIIFDIIYMSRNSRSIKTETNYCLAGLEVKNGDWLQRHERVFWGDVNVLKLDLSDSCTTLNLLKFMCT